MAKSKAQKQRAHAVRNGRPDPASYRLDNPDFSTHVRRTPSLQEKLDRQERKYKQ